MAALVVQAGKDADDEDNDDSSAGDSADDNQGEEALTTA